MRETAAREFLPEDGQTGGGVSIETDEDRGRQVLKVGEKIFAHYFPFPHG